MWGRGGVVLREWAGEPWAWLAAPEATHLVSRSHFSLHSEAELIKQSGAA